MVGHLDQVDFVTRHAPTVGSTVYDESELCVALNINDWALGREVDLVYWGSGGRT